MLFQKAFQGRLKQRAMLWPREESSMAERTRAGIGYKTSGQGGRMDGRPGGRTCSLRSEEDAGKYFELKPLRGFCFRPTVARAR